MKKQFFPSTLATLALALTLSAMNVGAETTPALSYGAANVLKLAQANVGEETMVAYIEKTGQGYNLGATEIIYLRDQGVSDRVIATMLAQEKKSRDASIAQAAAQPTAAPTPAIQPATTVVAAPQYVQPTYAQPSVTYVQPAPAPLIVMRDSSPRLVDYGIYPRHYNYNYGCYPNYGYRSYGYSYPRASFSIGFSGHHGSFGFSSGGYRGGYYCR